jgi:putative flavoprotein involved in K+ transport
MPFPGPRTIFPTKDQVADYLSAYATRFQLPIRLRTRVERVSARDDGEGFVVVANGQPMDADQVIVASGAFHAPRLPEFAAELDPSILQLHSSQYRRSSQLQDGPVLVVGAANSGAEIALDVAGRHRTTLVGSNTGHVPVDLDGLLGRIVDPLIWFAANHVLTIHTPIGRKARSVGRYHGHPVERARPDRLRAAGVEWRLGRVVGVRDGLPVLDDGQVVDAANVIWATGWRRDYSWIDLPILRDDGWPDEVEGVVASSPGLYFVGLPFQRALASSLLGGVGRDAADIVDHVVARARTTAGVTDPGGGPVASLERA